MDFFIQYYPLVKMLTTASLVLLTIWLVVKKRYMGAISVIITTALLLIYKPIKLKSNTDEVNQEDNKRIKQIKVIPPKIEDHSFEDRNKAIKHITKEELK